MFGGTSVAGPPALPFCVGGASPVCAVELPVAVDLSTFPVFVVVCLAFASAPTAPPAPPPTFLEACTVFKRISSNCFLLRTPCGGTEFVGYFLDFNHAVNSDASILPML